MRTYFTFALLAAVLCGACTVPSVHALYDRPSDGIEVAGLEGLWRGEDGDDEGDGPWYAEFTFDEAMNGYHIKFWGSADDSAKLEAVALEIGDRIYLDTIPDLDIELDEESSESMLFTAHVILGHLFYEIDVDGDVLKVGLIHNDEVVKDVEAQIKAGQPVDPLYGQAMSARGIAMTGKPRELRAWIRENQHREGYLVEEYGTLRRATEQIWETELEAADEAPMLSAPSED